MPSSRDTFRRFWGRLPDPFSLTRRRLPWAVAALLVLASLPTGWAVYSRGGPGPPHATTPVSSPAVESPPVVAAASQPAHIPTPASPPTPIVQVVPPVASVPSVPPIVRRPDLGVGDTIEAAMAGVDACLVAGEGPHSVISRNPDRPLVPASTQKLFIAAAALSRLGPSYRYQTTVVVREVPRNGEVQDLWLVGSGDPFLVSPEYAAFMASKPRTTGISTSSLETLADALVSRGVRTVTGTIHGDDGRYEATRYLPTWKESYRVRGDVPPLSALSVNGGWKSWGAQGEPAEDPPSYAASELARLLALRGVRVGGLADHAPAPQGAVVVAGVLSPPLEQIVAGMLQSSDNLAAELITRELGLRGSGEGTTVAGTRVAVTELERLGLPVGGLRLIDGSGLATGNRATCRLLAATLDLGDRPEMRAVLQGLSVAGRSGTLAHRMAGTPFEGRLRAKTGSIEGVVGLAGFLDGEQTLRFALLLNGAPSARRLEDRLLTLLAGYVRSQPAA